MEADEIQILLDQARLAINQGRYDEADALIGRVLAEVPQHEPALNLKGLLLFKQHRYEEAVELFKQLVAKYPEEPTLLMNLGLAYLKSERYEEAIEELEKALDYSPGNPKIHNYLGLAYSGLGRLQEAQHHFEAGGSKKMAEQMLKLMLGGGDRGGERTEATQGGAGEDTIDQAFSATFEAAGGATEEAASPPAAAGESAASVAGTAAEAPPPEAPVPERAATDLLGGALELLRHRYDAVLETLEAGRELTELAEVLALVRDREAEVDHVRPNLVRIRVDEERQVLVRLGEALALIGDLRAEPRKKRYKGKELAAIFGGEEDPVYALIGRGEVYLTAAGGSVLFPIRLEDELCYLVEEVFAAMAGQWRWENGRLPAEKARDLHLVQIRGSGQVVLRVPEGQRLGAVSLDGGKLLLPTRQLAGWFGNVVPMMVPLALPGQRPTDEGAVQFQGRGTVLLFVPAAL